MFISGGGSNMLALAASMQGDHPARPCLVISNDATAGGLKKAAEMGIATAAVDHKPFGENRAAFEDALIAELDKHQPDIICLAGFMRVLTAHFVGHYQGRMLNIHPSLLPKYKGLHTHKRALDAGDTYHGCTVHEVTPALDDGPILGQARLEIKADETPQHLAARVLPLEHQLYPQVLRKFAASDKTMVRLGF